MSLYTIIGAMSGTSMDGLDLSLSNYQQLDNEAYTYEIIATETFGYPDEIIQLLEKSKSLSTPDLFRLDKKIGLFFAERINDFIKSTGYQHHQINAIASHGHTVYHQPNEGFTVQIGCGDTIAYNTGIQVINDFRQKDVVANGQGAPLVPLGDELLFGQKADAFLNLGGFANITIPGSPTLAFDICPANLPMNQVCANLGLSYDSEGSVARSGTVDQEALDILNRLEFYEKVPPKSLGTEWLESTFDPVLKQIESNKDKLRTLVAHIADQIQNTFTNYNVKSLYISGGGALNTFLIEEISKKGNFSTVIPSKQEVEFKEALIFGFLGMRYLQGKSNVLASVTGAKSDVIGGVLHLP